MAQRDGDGVRRVVRARDVLHFEKSARHVHDLPLFRAAVADHRLLDLVGRVLKKRRTELLHRQQDHAAPVRNADAGGDVVPEKQLLDRHGVRVHCAQQLVHVVIEHFQPLWKRQPRRGGDRAVIHQPQKPPPALHNAKARGGVAGVDP